MFRCVLARVYVCVGVSALVGCLANKCGSAILWPRKKIPGEAVRADVPGPGVLAYASAFAEDAHQAVLLAFFRGRVAILGVLPKHRKMERDVAMQLSVSVGVRQATW